MYNGQSPDGFENMWRGWVKNWTHWKPRYFLISGMKRRILAARRVSNSPSDAGTVPRSRTLSRSTQITFRVVNTREPCRYGHWRNFISLPPLEGMGDFETLLLQVVQTEIPNWWEEALGISVSFDHQSISPQEVQIMWCKILQFILWWLIFSLKE